MQLADLQMGRTLTIGSLKLTSGALPKLLVRVRFRRPDNLVGDHRKQVILILIQDRFQHARVPAEVLEHAVLLL